MAGHRQPAPAAPAAPPDPADPAVAAQRPPLTVNELILAYWRFAQGYYVKDGRPTSEQDVIRQALRFVRRLYGSTPAADFGPLALQAVRQAMVEQDPVQGLGVEDPGGLARRAQAGAAGAEDLVDLAQGTGLLQGAQAGEDGVEEAQQQGDVLVEEELAVAGAVALGAGVVEAFEQGGGSSGST